MKKYILFFIILAGWRGYAQQVVVQTFISGGVATFPSGAVSSFGNVGQPMVLPRVFATSSGGGVAVAVDLMFTSSIDANPPVFPGTPALALTKSATSILSVNVTDQEGVSKVYVFHRPIAAGGTYDSTELTLSSGTTTNGTYSLDINTVQPTEFDNMGVEYYLKARDSKPNTVRHPLTGTLFGRMTDPSAQVPANLLSYGTQVSNYRMISIPYAFTNSISQVFDDLPPSDKTQYRFWKYESGAFVEYPDNFNTLERGEGYFIIMTNQLSTVVLSMLSQLAPSNHRASLFQMSLGNGWNFIGNPYTVPINWDDVKAYAGNPGSALGSLRSYTGSWNTITQLAPFQGAFVMVTGSQNITVPFVGQTTPGGREKPEFVKDLSMPNWKVNMSLRQNDLENHLPEFGMHPIASVQADETDDFNPPALFDHVEINFPHPEHFLGSFSTDVVNPQSEYVWRFNAEASLPDDIELSWDNSEFGDNDIELYLYDVRRNNVINMREDNRYLLSPGQSKEFKIYYGTDVREKIGPDQIEVFAPYPNPFGLKEPVKIAIGLPEGTQHYPVEMVIRNSMGQSMLNYSDDLAPGVHTITWDGRQPNGEAPSQGFYVYTVKVGNRNFTGKILFLNNQ